MKKQQIRLIILIVVLAALVGGYFGLKQYNRFQAAKAPEEPIGQQIVSLELEDIVTFSYDYENTNYAYEKVDGTWQYPQDSSITLNQSQIENMLTNITPLTAVDTITGVTDMSQYGLDQPSRTISFESAQESHIFYVGDYNSVSSVYYICKPSDTTVYAVEASVINGFDLDVMDLAETESEDMDITESTGQEIPTASESMGEGGSIPIPSESAGGESLESLTPSE